MAALKDVVWAGSSKKDLLGLPEEVIDEFGYGLYEAQQGLRPHHAKTYHIDGGAGTVELVENFETDTYRFVYTVRFEEAIYVLHCFKKKSTRGKETSQQDQALIKQRYRSAEEAHKTWIKEQSSKKT